MKIYVENIKIPLSEILEEGMYVELYDREGLHLISSVYSDSFEVYSELGAFKFKAIKSVEFDASRRDILITRLIDGFEDTILRALLKDQF